MLKFAQTERTRPLHDKQISPESRSRKKQRRKSNNEENKFALKDNNLEEGHENTGVKDNNIENFTSILATLVNYLSLILLSKKSGTLLHGNQLLEKELKN